jgi:MFS family permease
MISIAWFSACNLLAGLAPSFWLLLLFRAALGIGMGAEWPAGAALAMETWPSVRAASWGRSCRAPGALAPAVERGLWSAL